MSIGKILVYFAFYASVITEMKIVFCMSEWSSGGSEGISTYKTISSALVWEKLNFGSNKLNPF
jgi:hypothetical protein